MQNTSGDCFCKNNTQVTRQIVFKKCLRHKSFSTLMCKKDRRIESRSVGLTERKQNYPQKKFRVTFLQQILNASHVDLMTEINVCKTIRKKTYVAFTIWTVQSEVTCESGRAPSRESVYFGISKLTLYFPYFMYHVLCFSLCTFTL